MCADINFIKNTIVRSFVVVGTGFYSAVDAVVRFLFHKTLHESVLKSYDFIYIFTPKKDFYTLFIKHLNDL